MPHLVVLGHISLISCWKGIFEMRKVMKVNPSHIHANRVAALYLTGENVGKAFSTFI